MIRSQLFFDQNDCKNINFMVTNCQKLNSLVGNNEDFINHKELRAVIFILYFRA